MATTNHNSVGMSTPPKLGGGKPFGVGKPGGGRNRVPAASDFGIVGKPARATGRQKAPAATGSPSKSARPGGMQSANK